MTAEQRQYAIREYYYCKRILKDIAAELDIKPQALTNDRRRHKDEWDHGEKYWEFIRRCVDDRNFDDTIKEYREQLIGLLSDIKAIDEDKCKLHLAVGNPDVRPDFLAMILENYIDIENFSAKREKKLYEFLIDLLTERYNLS